jgi:hypothetical protein
MKDYGCCTLAASGSGRQPLAARNSDGERQIRKFGRRFLDIAGWVIPGTVLALLPKCPACLAVYVAIGTGVGLSLSSATFLWMALLIFSLASLSYLAGKGLRRYIFRVRPSHRIY